MILFLALVLKIETREKRHTTRTRIQTEGGESFLLKRFWRERERNLDLSWIKNDSDALEEMKIPELLKLLTEKKQNISDAVTELQKELVECKL